MAIDFKLPDLGENIDSGDVVTLLVHEGDTIEANQNVVELETDKATVEIPCPYAGRVTKIHVQPGQTVPIGSLLVSVEAGRSVPPSQTAQRDCSRETRQGRSPQAGTRPSAAAAATPAKQASQRRSPSPTRREAEDDDDHAAAPARKSQRRT